MKARLAVAVLLLSLIATACTRTNLVAPKDAPASHMDDNGAWLGSGS